MTSTVSGSRRGNNRIVTLLVRILGSGSSSGGTRRNRPSPSCNGRGGRVGGSHNIVRRLTGTNHVVAGNRQRRSSVNFNRDSIGHKLGAVVVRIDSLQCVGISTRIVEGGGVGSTSAAINKDTVQIQFVSRSTGSKGRRSERDTVTLQRQGKHIAFAEIIGARGVAGNNRLAGSFNISHFSNIPHIVRSNHTCRAVRENRLNMPIVSSKGSTGEGNRILRSCGIGSRRPALEPLPSGDRSTSGNHQVRREGQIRIRTSSEGTHNGVNHPRRNEEMLG